MIAILTKKKHSKNIKRFKKQLYLSTF